MKRDNRDGNNGGPPMKLQKGDLSNISVRFLIPARAAGLIIGKGGENIKKIRSQNLVKLNIPDNRGIERVFTVDGELSIIAKVVNELVPKIKDVMNAKLSDPKRIMGLQRNNRRQRGSSGNALEEDEEDEGMIDLRILVHQSVAGSIIGRGGDRIREFRSKHKMRVIKVYQMLAPGSTDRVVQLVAEPDNAIACLQSVIEVVENTPIRGEVKNYDSANSSEPDALQYGGWVSPEGQRAFSQGMPMNEMQGPGMGPPRGMPPMGRGGYNRGPRSASPPMPTNMYNNGRMMGGPPPINLGQGRRSGYEQAPYGMHGGYDNIPPMNNMYGSSNQPIGYDEPQGTYQPPSNAYDKGMVLQNTGGYGGPVSRMPQNMGGPSGYGGMPYKGTQSGMYGGSMGNYRGGPPEDNKSGQWGW